MNWAAHFQGVSRRHVPADFGTLLGSHTAHELAVDMLNWQGFVTSMATSVAIDGSNWKTADESGWNRWLSEWTPFRSRWDKAVTAAQKVIAEAQSSMLGWDYTPVESDYKAILQVYQNGRVPSPGGFDDLYRRWLQAGKAKAPEVRITIDPNAAADLDLVTYQAADSALKEVEKAAAKGKSTLPWLVGGAFAILVVIAKIVR